MTTPAVNLPTVKLKGNKLEFTGSLDNGGDTGLTLNFYLDPQPTGTPFGPFPLTVAGVAYAQSSVAISAGKWKVRIVATPTIGAPIIVTTPEIAVSNMKCRLVMPGISGVKVPSPASSGIYFGDLLTKAEYSTAVSLAPVGQKRAAGANALINSLGSKPRLFIYQNNVPVILAEYSGLFTMTNDGTNIAVKPAGQMNVTILKAADINQGVWTFELQGGTFYTRSLRGSVGPEGSGKNITLAISTVIGNGFASDYSFLLARAMDGLS
jgi:hypothetical protein